MTLCTELTSCECRARCEPYMHEPPCSCPSPHCCADGQAGYRKGRSPLRASVSHSSQQWYNAVQEAKKIGDEYLSLEKYVNLNYLVSMLK